MTEQNFKYVLSSFDFLCNFLNRGQGLLPYNSFYFTKIALPKSKQLLGSSISTKNVHNAFNACSESFIPAEKRSEFRLKIVCGIESMEYYHIHGRQSMFALQTPVLERNF